jgi:hypothetical protein
MSTSERILGIEHNRTESGAARRRSLVAALMLATLAIAAVVAKPAHADTSSPPPVSQCSDFACEQ